jgi:hypothetical protein
MDLGQQLEVLDVRKIEIQTPATNARGWWTCLLTCKNGGGYFAIAETLELAMSEAIAKIAKGD